MKCIICGKNFVDKDMLFTFHPRKHLFSPEKWKSNDFCHLLCVDPWNMNCCPVCGLFNPQLELTENLIKSLNSYSKQSKLLKIEKFDSSLMLQETKVIVQKYRIAIENASEVAYIKEIFTHLYSLNMNKDQFKSIIFGIIKEYAKSPRNLLPLFKCMLYNYAPILVFTLQSIADASDLDPDTKTYIAHFSPYPTEIFKSMRSCEETAIVYFQAHLRILLQNLLFDSATVLVVKFMQLLQDEGFFAVVDGKISRANKNMIVFLAIQSQNSINFLFMLPVNWDDMRLDSVKIIVQELCHFHNYNAAEYLLKFLLTNLKNGNSVMQLLQDHFYMQPIQSFVVQLAMNVPINAVIDTIKRISPRSPNAKLSHILIHSVLCSQAAISLLLKAILQPDCDAEMRSFLVDTAKTLPHNTLMLYYEECIALEAYDIVAAFIPVHWRLNFKMFWEGPLPPTFPLELLKKMIASFPDDPEVKQFMKERVEEHFKCEKFYPILAWIFDAQSPFAAAQSDFLMALGKKRILELSALCDAHQWTELKESISAFMLAP